MARRLPASFYLQPTRKVARELLGKILCVKTRAGIIRARIVETEAYLGARDRAAHTFGGRRTERNEAMYSRGGHVYVYFIYGMHYCMNVVTRAVGEPEAVLLRALEPLDDGDSDMRMNGPGKLCRALGIDRKMNGLDLTAKNSPIWIERAPKMKTKREKIHSGPRVGIDYAGEAKDWPLRFLFEGNRHVSKKPVARIKTGP